MKTLLEALHREDGPPGQNRVDCRSREHNGGKCPGEWTADWLNGLGPDSELYGTVDGKAHSNGDVRRAWLAHSGHLRLLPAKE